MQAQQSQTWAAWEPSHQRALQLLRDINLLPQPQLASSLTKTLCDHYHTALRHWLEQSHDACMEQEKRLQQANETAHATMQRYHTWQQRLATWLQALGPAATSLPALPSTNSLITDPAVFSNRLAERWHYDDFAAIETLYTEHERAWKDALRQGRDTASALHSTLVNNLTAAQQRLDTVWENQQKDFAAEQQLLQKPREQAVLTSEQLDKALETLKQLQTDVSKTLPLPTPTSEPPLKKSKSLTPADTKPNITDFTAKEFAAQPFWQDAANAVHTIEQRLGTAPCGFSVVVWNNSAPDTLLGQWQWGLLIASTTSDEPDDYWHVFCHMLNSQLTSLPTTPAGLQWANSDTFFVTENNFTPYRQNAHCLAISHTQPDAAKHLLSTYQRHAQRQQQATTATGVLTARQWGYDGLQTLKNLVSLPSALSQPYRLAENLLYPSLHWCQYVGSYYGLAPASHHAILDVLTRAEHCHAGFIADVRNAIDWAEIRLTALAQAWATQLPPPKLAPGEVLILPPDSPATPIEQQPFYLTAAEYTTLKQHYHRTVALLAQTHQAWSLHTPPATDFDPLRIWFDQTLARVTHHQLPKNAVLDALQTLVATGVHRRWTTLEQQLPIFWAIPEEYRKDYMRLLASAVPDQQALIQQLRHIPTASGQRLRWQEEQTHWQQQSLPRLWESKPLTSSASTTISVARQVIIGGQKQWRVETYPLKPEIGNQLFLATGEWQPKDKTTAGNHRVYPIEIDRHLCFWVKVYPEQPASEFLVTELDRRLGVWGTPQIELVKFHHGGKTSAALVTSAIEGANLQTVVDKTPTQLRRLSFTAFIRTLLRVLLTNPEDDKGDDYFLVPQTDGSHALIRIDNERVFFQPSSSSQKLLFKSDHLIVKSIIYCLEQMQWQWAEDSAVAEIVEDFLRLQPVALMSDLLQTADQLHDGWNELFSAKEVAEHFGCKDPWTSLPVMCIPNGLAGELITRLTTLNTAMRMDYRHMTGLQLLKITQPKLAQYYAASHLQSPNKARSPTDKKGSSAIANSQFQLDAKPTARDAADHSRVSARFERVAGHLYQKKPKGSQDPRQSLIPNSIAMQSSLRLESPIDLPTLQKIRTKELCSARQQLAEFNQWQKTQRLRLLDDLLAQRPTAIAEWQGLPLRQQYLLFTQLQTKGEAKSLSLDQQRFILRAMAAVVGETAWPQLNFKGFESALTDALLEPLVKGTGQQLLQLNLNDCMQLTDKSLQTILTSNPNLRQLSAQRINWTNLSLTTLPHLEQLDLSGSGIQTLVGEAPCLHSLQLNNCQQLRSLGASSLLQNTVFSAPDLTQVNLSGCQRLIQFYISQATFNKSINQALPSCTALRFIDLKTETDWVHVPNFLIQAIRSGVSKLEYSNTKRLTAAQRMTTTQWKQLMNYLSYDQTFTHIDFSNSQLDDVAAQTLAEVLKSNTTLTALNLGRNPLGDKAVQALAEALKSNTTLAALDLSGNQLSNAGVQALAEAIKTNPALINLDLSGGNPPDAEKQLLGVINAYLARNRINRDAALATLDLSHNKLGDAGVQVLAEVLKTNTILTTLNLCNTQLGKVGTQALAKMLKTNTALASLHLNQNDLGDSDVQALAEALKTNTTLTNLNLWNNQLSDAGAQALVEALKNNATLTTLDLGSNLLGDASAQAVAEILKTNTTLATLNLGLNQLGATSAQALAKALETNTTLIKLDLGGNGVGEAGAWALANLLEANTALTTLNLRLNQLGATSAQALAEALKTNIALTTLNLSENWLGDAGAQALAEVLKTNTTLSILNLNSNQLGDAGAQLLAEALKTNTTLTELFLENNQFGEAGKAAKGEIEGCLVRNRELQKTAKITTQPKGSKSAQSSSSLLDKKVETKSTSKMSVNLSAADISLQTAPAVEASSHTTTRNISSISPREHKVDVEVEDDAIAILPSSQPLSGLPAPHSQFFTFLAPVDEKAQTLLSKARIALGRAYPPSMTEHSATHQAYLAQLAGYQSRLGVLNKIERDTLQQLVTTLEEVAAQRDHLAQSSSTTTLG